MADPGEHPRDLDEWRVEVRLEQADHGLSIAERLSNLRLDDKARERLSHDVIVTRDGPHVFLYAWHEQSAREAESTVRELIEEEGLAAEVTLKRWHPVEDAWRDAHEPLPETPEQRREERHRHAEAEAKEFGEEGRFDWEVIVDLPDLGSTFDFARRLREEGMPVKHRWKHLLVGALTEESAIQLGRQIEELAPEGSHVGIRANPAELPAPGFVFLGSLKPGGARDLGL